MGVQLLNSLDVVLMGIALFWVDVALLYELCVVCFNFFVAGFIVAWPTDLFQRSSFFCLCRQHMWE